MDRPASPTVHTLNLKSSTLSPPLHHSRCVFTFKREFFLDGPEPNTNGCLPWKFSGVTAERSGPALHTRDTGWAGLAKLWDKQKIYMSMNYDKISRALRYY
ncbi:ets DNA-binding protein pokkuri-like [Culex pipiens pallens]|uniref:ets DNA-binding protein pokkuri-like n=1 Tax=Culex pipiens pallens TaxID=42434 RepID=UPI0022AA74CA|nr:ets DNA-binding protein pokkuri-like [Culex pipiens pallens]XP_052562338.1 ets DNA-binding protein pokkuri-like [Culex pipiens pallens]